MSATKTDGGGFSLTKSFNLGNMGDGTFLGAAVLVGVVAAAAPYLALGEGKVQQLVADMRLDQLAPRELRDAFAKMQNSLRESRGFRFVPPEEEEKEMGEVFDGLAWAVDRAIRAYEEGGKEDK